MHISREENTGQNHTINIGNESFEVMAVFRHEQQLHINIAFIKKWRAD
jgi:hypothetical protein